MTSAARLLLMLVLTLAALAIPTLSATAGSPPAGLTPPGADYRWDYTPGAGGSFGGYGWVRRPQPCPVPTPAPVPEPTPAPVDPGTTDTYRVECVMVDCTTADKRAEVMLDTPTGRKIVRIDPGVRLTLDWADATGLDPCQVYAWAFTEPVLKKQAQVTTGAAGRVTAVSVYHVLHDGRPWYAETGTVAVGGQQPTPQSVPVRRCPNVVATAAPVVPAGGCSGGRCLPAAVPLKPVTDCPNGRCPLAR